MRYKKSNILLVFLLAILLPNISSAFKIKDELSLIGADYKNFYLEKDNLLALITGVATSGLLANTSADNEMQKYFQKRIRGNTTDVFANISNTFGDFYITIPLLSATYLFAENDLLKQWSEKSLRSILVGAPVGLFLQRVTGGVRPDEGDSSWKPMNGSSGVSGHAFIGSIPFITAAMQSDSIFKKTFFYTLSFLPGLARINKNKHYLSQVGLGWYIGYLSCNVVYKNKDLSSVTVIPYGDGILGFITYSF